MRSLADYDLEELRRQLADWGIRPAQAAKVLGRFYRSAGRPDVDGLSLGSALLQRLGRSIPIRRSKVILHTDSADGTRKLLVGLDSGGAVESVLMPAYHPQRAAGCISSQIGCAMGCDFCASTRNGLVRNLESGEIVEQYLHLAEQAALLGRRLTTLVFMGMGEPMHNLPNVIVAIRRISHPGMGNLGGRRITVSTVGVVSGIEQLAAADLGVHLALSLHAPDDETRARIVPAGRRWGVEAVIDATRRFQERTGRIPTIEYCLLDGINDADWQAELLAGRLAGLRMHVNLIPYNPIGAGLSGVEYHAPPAGRMERFLEILTRAGVVAHFRRTRGDDVSAACGQLAQLGA